MILNRYGRTGTVRYLLAPPGQPHRSIKSGGVARCWAVLVLAVIGAFPLAVAHAGGAQTILLRYQFAPGQHFAYRLTGFVREDIVQAGHLPSVFSLAVDSVFSYHILAVAPNGVADAAAGIESAVITQTANGQSHTIRAGPSQAALTEQHVQLGPDNSLPDRKAGALVSNSYGNYGLQAIGALPPYAVMIGQHWQSSATDNLAAGIDSAIPALPHVRLVADNVVTGVGVDAGMPVAMISSHSDVNYVTDTVQGGRAVHVRAIGTLTISSLFDLTRKLLRASTAAIDVTYTVTTPISAGGHVLARTHFVDDATLRPATVTT